MLRFVTVSVSFSKLRCKGQLKKMDYKETLSLPKTPFPMRGNLPVKEKEMLAFWDRINLYGQMIKNAADRPTFILHDGPPYANGNIHLGTALNKILKDI